MREQGGCICNVKFLCIQSILFFQNVVVADILCAAINGLVDIVPWSSVGTAGRCPAQSICYSITAGTVIATDIIEVIDARIFSVFSVSIRAQG